jgi:polyisoprenoid-binding protein YceI
VGRYRIDPARSRVSIDARSSLHPIHTQTDGLDGWLEIDVVDGGIDVEADPRGHVEFPVSKLASGNPLEDRELQRRIDSRRFPTISGDLESMKATDESTRYLVAGALTFRGVKRRYTDEITLDASAVSTVKLSGQSVFDIRDFGMEPPRILMLKVQPEVTVRIDIVAVRESEANGG